MSKLLTLLIFLLIGFNSNAQQNARGVTLVQNKIQFDSLLHKLILKDYYVDVKKGMKVIFILKVDSLGEIHSDHVSWSLNLSEEKYYLICSKIEKYVNAKFIYQDYADHEISSKYAYCHYPFFVK
jgi:hypothetical protein